jgi:hypothetical protein
MHHVAYAMAHAAHISAHVPAHAPAPLKIWALQLACSTLFCIALCAVATWYIHDPAPGTWEMGDVLFGMLYALGVGIILRVALGLLSFAARLGRFSSH